MHETMGQLDVQVRDDVLSCIQRLEIVRRGDDPASRERHPRRCVPRRARLDRALYEGGGKRRRAGRVVEPDSFYGVRDAIHRIAPSVTAIARAGTTVAFFDAARLQELCERSPEQVVAVLERLG